MKALTFITPISNTGLYLGLAHLIKLNLVTNTSRSSIKHFKDVGQTTRFRHKFKFTLPAFLLLILGNIVIANGQMEMPANDIKHVMETHTAKLMELPGVVGVYIGALEDGSPCIKVMVIKKTNELEEKIPKDLEGFPVVVVETGELIPHFNK